VRKHFCFAQFRHRDTNRTGFELASRHFRRLQRLEVRPQLRGLAFEEGSHPGDVRIDHIKVEEKAGVSREAMSMRGLSIVNWRLSIRGRPPRRSCALSGGGSREWATGKTGATRQIISEGCLGLADQRYLVGQHPSAPGLTLAFQKRRAARLSMKGVSTGAEIDARHSGGFAGRAGQRAQSVFTGFHSTPRIEDA
jgi:hypothetical protein